MLAFASHKSMACRVLIADDNSDAAESLAMLIAVGGHQVQVVYSGSEACQRALDWRPEVLVLDIGMPGMSGYEVTRSVRQQPWGQRVLLLATTGWGRDDDKEHARRAGFDRHLTKPVNVDELLGIIADFALQRTGGQQILPMPTASV